jgi:hypothetical protein
MNKMSNQNIVLDLSWTRKQEIRWLGSYSIDVELLNQCAMYPKPPAFGQRASGCTECSVSEPKKSCQYSHLLTFSESNKKQIKSNKVMKMLSSLSEEDREAVEQFLRERREREER